MESAGKRRGLVKAKLMMSSLCRAAAHQNQKKGKPKQLATSVGFLMNQDIKPQAPMLNVSFFLHGDQVHSCYQDSVGRVEDYFGDIDDERVNMKASRYISCVRERLRNEGI